MTTSLDDDDREQGCMHAGAGDAHVCWEQRPDTDRFPVRQGL
jgi:hypothetical protein